MENELYNLKYLEDKKCQTKFISVDADLLLKRIGELAGIIVPKWIINQKRRNDWEELLKSSLGSLSENQLLSFLARIFRACDYWIVVKIISNKLAKERPPSHSFQLQLWNSEANYYLGKYDIASKLARMVLSNSNKDMLLKAQSFNILGNIASRSISTHKRKWAIGYYKKAIDNLRGNTDDELLTIANSHLDLGIFYKNVGKFVEANNEFKNGIRIAKKVGALMEIAKMEEAIGIVSRWQIRELIQQNKINKSLLYYRNGTKAYENALDLTYSLGAMTEYGRVLSNYANLEMEYCHLSSHLVRAKLLVDQSILVEKLSSNNCYEIVKREGQKAKILQIEKKWEEALTQWKNIRYDLVDILQIGVYYREMAQCYYMVGDVSKSKKYINKSLEIFPQGPEKKDSLIIKEYIYHKTLQHLLS